MVDKLRSKSDPNRQSTSPSTSQRSSTRIVAIDLNPETYSSQFDLATELQSNIDFYRGDECVTLRPIPGYVKESLERYQSTFPSKRPGINPISSACIWGGIQSFRSQPSIRTIAQLQESRRQTSSETDDNRYDMTSNLFKSWRIEVLPSYLSGNQSLNIGLPEIVNAALGGLGADLGISKGSLAAISIAEIIREQETTLKGHRRKLDEAVNLFLILCQARVGVLESALEMMRQTRK